MTGPAGTCQYDTGSMYGNVPLCAAAAEWRITYRNGSYGPFAATVCDAHRAATLARAYPGVEAVQRIPGWRELEAEWVEASSHPSYWSSVGAR